MIETMTAIDLMEQCDSIYVDKLVSGEWQVEAVLDCSGFTRQNQELIKAIQLACEVAIEETRISTGLDQ